MWLYWIVYVVYKVYSISDLLDCIVGIPSHPPVFPSQASKSTSDPITVRKKTWKNLILNKYLLIGGSGK